jgi:hypothetical protein
VDLAFWTPEQLSQRGFETTTGAEVTPRWVTGLLPYTPVAATAISGDAVVRQPGRTPFAWTSPVSSKVASTIEMNTAWFPGWEVRIDGQRAPAGPGTPSGLIAFQVPAGEHVVDVRYGRTAAEKVAAGISIAALMLALVLARLAAGKPARRDSLAPPPGAGASGGH